MLEWLKEKILTKYLGSILRTALAALGGFLVAKYGIDQATADQLVANLYTVAMAVLPIVIAQVWSLIQKAKS